MIHYPLEWCEKAGFDSILVLTLTEHHTAIQSYIRAHRIQKTSLYIQTEAASDINDNLGTADVLRVAYKNGWLNSDFAVLPCDLVTNLEGSKLAELFMVTQAGFDGDLGRRSRKSASAGDGEDGRRGGLAVWYDTMGEGAIKGQETDFVITSPIAKSCAVGNDLPDGEVGTLLDTMPTLALKGVNNLRIRHTMLRKFPDVKLHSTYRDSGVYFFPHWVLRFIEHNPRLNSIREDVLPWLAKARWQNARLATKLGLPQILGGNSPVSGDNDSEQTLHQEYDVGSMSNTRPRRLSRTNANEPTVIPPIVTYLPASQTLFMRRVDTVHLYLYTSLHLAKSDPSQVSTAVKIDPSAYIGEKAIVTAIDCLIAEKASIGERSVIKKSVIGAGVSIGRGARIMGCVLMDGASVAENAKLEGCLIGRKANIGAKVVLKDCEVAGGYFVEDGVDAKGEQFVAFGLDPETEDEYDGEDDEEENEKAEDGDGDDDEDDDGDYSPGHAPATGPIAPNAATVSGFTISTMPRTRNAVANG
ncbi:hypothetical protein EDC01DRAFT_716098 [Geopyxis carbonaria]|nr:hypothetical protein EDC01DRAFT_716098 [Geopyxis carbonaria]